MTPCDPADLEIDVLLVDDPEVYRRARRPMIGRAFRLPWWNVCTWLSRPSLATHKAQHGAWTPARFAHNHKKKEHLIHADALLVDVDDCGDVDAIADLFAPYLGCVHSTFSSTPVAPRCRIVLPLAESVDAPMYEHVWRIVVVYLEALGVRADRSAKDAGRLGFLPCVRAGDSYRFRPLGGALLDARAIIAAQPPEPPRRPPTVVAADHRDRYVRGALRRACINVATASEGMRHYTLSREAFGLARLGLSLEVISDALIPSFVAAAGEQRRHEGERTVRDAVHARGAA